MPLEDDYVAGNPAWNGSERLIVVSGCSCGGKSTLLGELARRGYGVQPEPGRQIVKEQLYIGGDGLPWANAARFIELCVNRAMLQYNQAAPTAKPVVFDRSIIDAVTAFASLGLAVPPHLAEAARRYRYAKRVFFAPPWSRLFANDSERRHSFAEAEAEYERLLESYPAHGYEVVELPRAGVTERADFFEEEVGRREEP